MAEGDGGAGRPMSQPAKELPFDDALTETMRDHRGALAALDDDPEYRRLMAIGLCVMRKHRGALAALAESERQDREADLAAVETFRRKLAAGEDEFVPAAVVDRILDGESRVSTALGVTLDDIAG